MKEKNRKNWRISVLLAGMAIALTWVWAPGLHALKYPHNPGYANPVSCNNCHSTVAGFKSLTSLDAMCINASGCHNSSGKAGKRRLTTKSASNRFNSLPPVANAKQSSHGWDIPNTNPNAGATNNWYPAREYSGWTPLKERIGCTRCHRAHGDMVNVPIYRSFLKGDPKGDDICFQCHAARRVNNVRDALPSTSLHYSHPVEVNYSSARAKPGKSDFFFRNPTSSFPANPSATLRLYTTKGGLKGAVICSTCHGPLHSADSNPYTFDNLTTYASGNYSTSGGNLLRRYDKKNDVTNDLCKSCHKVTTHRSFNCYRCHTPHKKAGENNRYLILENISTPNSGMRSVQFISTSEMADRYGSSNAICQVCHTETAHHRNYSTSAADRAHNNIGGVKYKNCAGCHSHTVGFTSGGCTSCHGFPPAGTFNILSGAGRVNATKKRPSGNSASEGVQFGAHQKHINVYGSGTATCSKCHYSGMWSAVVENSNIDLEFRAFNVYTGSGQKYTGQPAVRTGYYGYSGVGITAGDTQRCNDMKCHGGGWLTASYGAVTAPKWSDANTATCGKCHGAKKAAGSGSWPTSNAHTKHAGTGGGQYDLACKLCHTATVVSNWTTLDDSVHVNGQANIGFDTTDARVGASTAYSGDTNVNSGFGSCSNAYCHSNGTATSAPFAAPNYAAVWSATAASITGGKPCSLCHGNTMSGYTAAMPNYANGTPKANSHPKHVINNGIQCKTCHASTVNADNVSIKNKALHVNAFYNVSVGDGKVAGTFNYNTGMKKCSNVTCHGGTGNVTPAWGTAGNCVDCHRSNSADVDDFAYNNETMAKIYTSEFATRGHGASGGTYPVSGNNKAGKVCLDCHDSGVSHNNGDTYFRLKTGSDPDTLCLRCHGSGGQLAVGEFGNVTGILSHTYENMSTYVQYQGGTNGKAGWDFTPKCVDCHDPHGDKNNYMIQKYINMTGSDPAGRPTQNATALVTFTTVGGQMNWSSYVNSDKTGLCQRCHSPEVGNFNKGTFNSAHNNGNRCTDCHKHRKAFAPSGCDSCHGYPPPKGPSGWAENSATPSTVGLHTPHAFNGTTGMPAGDGVSGTRGYKCVKCHGPNANGQDNNHGTGKLSAAMVNLTGSAGIGATWTPNFSGMTSVTDDTCSNVSCHTPRGYARTWKKPTRCDSCHGFQNKTSMTFNLQNTGSHATHITYTTAGGAEKKYGLACTQCHVNNQNDYSSHYTSRVDMNFGSGLSTTAAYSRGSAFKGATTGGEYGTCSAAYCHGNFTNGTTATVPKWGNTMAGCINCHKGRANEASMPERHPKHAAASGYNFGCVRCHNATVSDDTTIMDYSKHVNGMKDLSFDDSYMDNTGGSFNSGTRQCANIYCHSDGTDLVEPFAAMPNYTADWDDASGGCNYCHGNTMSGYTAAMPNYDNGSPKANSHPKHVIANGIQCKTCHASTVNADNASIKNKALHVNAFYNVSVGDGKVAGTFSYDTAGKKCSNVTCHGGSVTPAWGTAGNCIDCHRSNSADVDDFAYNNETMAKIYTSEFATRGHGRSAGTYPFSGNNNAGKVCLDCHDSGVSHNNGSTYFRLKTGSDPDTLCLRCHGSGGQLAVGEFGNVTGIQSHTYNNMSTAGYMNLTTWAFTPKCVDCHDPHGDKNNYMIQKFVNYSGSDSAGRPVGSGIMVNFTAVNGGAQINWSSYVRGDNSGLCQRCHSSAVDNFAKDKFKGNHYNAGKRCPECHKHKKGFTPPVGCNACHGNPPANGPDGWSENSATPSTVGLHTPHAFNGTTGMPAGNSVNGGKGYTCATCHGPNANGQDNNHGSGKLSAAMVNLTGSAGIGATWTPNAIGKTSVTDDTCSNVRCHTPRSYSRTWKKPTRCDSCHGFQNKTSLTFNLQNTGSHATHITYTTAGADSKKYGLACTQCHVNNQNDYSSHYTSRVDMNFESGLSSGLGTVYTRGSAFKGFTTGNEFGACANVYCHGEFPNGGSTGNGNAATPTWGQPALTCGICHMAKVSAASMPERHPKHSALNIDNGYNFGCVRCHNATVSGDTAIKDFSKHVNGTKDVYFDGSAMNNSGGSFNSGTRQCANIYCHSSGTDLVAPFTALPNYTADWDVTASGRTGGKPCSFCHGNTMGGYTAAMPNYPSGSPKVNSHPKHVIVNGIQCKTCHASTVNADNVTIKNRTLHVNAFYNVSVGDGKVAGTFSYDTIEKKCSNITCHGGAGNTTPAWGSAITCGDCHLAAADVKDYNYGTTQAKINETEWADTGHGRSSGTYPGTDAPAANRTCTNCHSSSIPHGDTGKPFRTWTSDLNSFCLGCHGSGADLYGAGPFPSRTGIQVHTYKNISTAGYKNLTTWRFTPKCVDCHDPHGDGNLAMIRSKVSTGGSNDKGVPNAFVNGSTVVFNKFAGAESEPGSFAYSTPDRTSVCRVCHTRTKYNNITGGITHNPGKNCTECHAHERGFAPASCDTCHGFPPTSTDTLVGGAGTAEFEIMSTTGSQTAGAHNRHAVQMGYLCSTCHTGGMAGSNMYNNKITLSIKAFGMYTTGVYSGQTSVAGDNKYGYEGQSAPLGGGGSYTKTCSNVKCHGAGGNWLTKSDGAVVNPVWDNPSTVVCGNCHGAKKAPSTGGYPDTNAHARHAGYGGGQYNFMCKKCHSGTVLTTATTLSSTHVNAEVQFRFYTTDDQRIGSGAYNGGDTVVNSGFGRCENTYCHSRGTNKVAPYTAAGSYANYTAKWDKSNVPASRCSYCHGNKTYGGVNAAMPAYNSGSPKVNGHVKHVIDNGITCDKCHYNTTRDGLSIYSSALHVNKAYDIRIHPTYNLGGASYDGSKCSNIKCHGGNDSPTWGTSASCSTCHYAVADVDNFVYGSFTGVMAKISQTQFTSVGHGRSSGTYTVSGNSGAGMSCGVCHKANVSHGATANPFRLFTSDPNAVCRNCHGSGSALNKFGTTPAMSNITGVFHHASSIVQGSSNFDVKCVDCHDPHGDNNIFMVHSTVTKATAANNYRLSNQYGVPFTNESSFNVDFTNNTSGGGYATTAAANGNSKICNVCHTRTEKADGPRYQRNMAGASPIDTHNSASKCTDCHKHKAGFKGAGACNGCHAYPPDPTDARAAIRHVEGEGAHVKHVNHIKTLGNYTLQPQTDQFGVNIPIDGGAGAVCGTCHTNNSANHQTGSRLINFGDGTNSAALQFGTGTPFYNGTSDTSSADGKLKNCSNVRCHFKNSPVWAAY